MPNRLQIAKFADAKQKPSMIFSSVTATHWSHAVSTILKPLMILDMKPITSHLKFMRISITFSHFDLLQPYSNSFLINLFHQNFTHIQWCEKLFPPFMISFILDFCHIKVFQNIKSIQILVQDSSSKLKMQFLNYGVNY